MQIYYLSLIYNVLIIGHGFLMIHIFSTDLDRYTRHDTDTWTSIIIKKIEVIECNDMSWCPAPFTSFNLKYQC